MIKSSFFHQLNCLNLDLHPQSKSAVQCHDVDLVDIGGAERVTPTNKHHVQRPSQYQRALRHQQRHVCEDFIRKYIFPGGHLPTVTQLVESINKGSQGKLIVDQIENIGPHYS